MKTYRLKQEIHSSKFPLRITDNEFDHLPDSDKPLYERIKKGFAAMDPEKQKSIASKGGKSSHGGGRKPKNRVNAIQ